ncbi:uncharacterized protein LOC111053581 [Nilaparvata lugens]|uniref:uncharacterized protein LOC111053581 n=1 Tax=Nilaparvata lugens TaxID=108931 RepID=UPI00193D70F1|nr:uncharacterized protein LOC111053581 [Nilaparvata lugens]
MKFFLVFKALIWIYLISFSSAEEEKEISIEETVQTDTVTGRNKVFEGSTEGMVVTAFLIKPDFHMFNQEVDNPEFKEKAACFQLEEEVANSLKLKPVKFMSYTTTSEGISKAGDFSLLYTKIFSCLTNSLYAFLHVERAFEVLSPVKEIHYDPNVLSIARKNKWSFTRKLFCVTSEKKLYVTEKSFRGQTDINKVIRLEDGVKVTFYDKEYMEKNNFWPQPSN